MKKITFIISFCICIKAIAQIPTNGLVSSYMFNGNINDNSGYSNNLIPYGNPIPSVDRFGITDAAYTLNGNGDYFQAINSGPSGKHSRAICFWAKSTHATSGFGQAVVYYGNPYGDRDSTYIGQRFEVGINSFCYGLYVDVSQGSNTATYTNTIDGNWHFYVVNFDSATSKIEFYVDATQVANICSNIGSMNKIQTSNKDPITIGTFYNVSPRYFNGSLDDILIYNRALTYREISQIYYAPSVPSPINRTLLVSIISIMLLFIAIAFLIIKLVTKRIKRKEEEKTRINKLLAEYHMSALRAQMNPHFIFNCINSIQRYVLVNQPQEAYNYLSKFSKLMRLVLNYSEENFISLLQEIEITELYLELEKKRFEDRFTYSLNILGNIDQHEIKVPVLIMQPYIENSIWHGIMNLDKQKAGHIEITISLDEEILTVIIEDNGVGRDKASSLSKKTHQSKANKINNLRAEILAAMTDVNKSSVVIEDVKQNDVVVGTKVILNIPQNIHNNNEYD